MSILTETESFTFSDLEALVEAQRLDVSSKTEPGVKSQYGQFMTPSSIAAFMASLFRHTNEDVSLLDAGAGLGSLSAAFLREFCRRDIKPGNIHITAFEIDEVLFQFLNATLKHCRELCRQSGILLATDARKDDFIEQAVSELSDRFFTNDDFLFSHVILNPPYRKIGTNSRYRRILGTLGIETSNLYSAFLSLAVKLLKPGGELVAITPRSFCNGPYFKFFRKLLLTSVSLDRIHVFESRADAFNDDQVLQENIIFHGVKQKKRDKVVVTSSFGADFDTMTNNVVGYSGIVRPEDHNLFIHIPTNTLDEYVHQRVGSFTHSLCDLGLEASTGGIVDFRAKSFLLDQPGEDAVPLIYPGHFDNGFIRWPKEESNKPNAVLHDESIEKFFLPNVNYLLVKRFSPKEEVRRISCAIYHPESTGRRYVAFENHLNVIYSISQKMSLSMAKGLYLYLSSSLVDMYFRHFNGHTQVNACDLRALSYPSAAQLKEMGNFFDNETPSQDEIDEIIEKEVQRMTGISSPDPVPAKRKIEEAKDILKQLGFPRSQQNDRSALTLLALCDLKPKDTWGKAKQKVTGITPIIEFCAKHYGKTYAPNTRETIRRQTMHQFVSAELVTENPGCRERPINSPKWCYQIDKSAVALLRLYKKDTWKVELTKYLAKRRTIRQKHAKHRKMPMVPVEVDGKEVNLSPGRHNELIKSIIEDFAPRFVPGAKVLYVGDTAQKWAYLDHETCASVGLHFDVHGKMPDVVLYHQAKDWIILVEAVTSHGPVDWKRREELLRLFEKVQDKLVFVTAFPSRSELGEYLKEISWETEVWIADSPSHLIHFNGERFLGPYEL
jgi:adenine-specific DNA-methyltransferase